LERWEAKQAKKRRKKLLRMQQDMGEEKTVFDDEVSPFSPLLLYFFTEIILIPK